MMFNYIGIESIWIVSERFSRILYFNSNEMGIIFISLIRYCFLRYLILNIVDNILMIKLKTFEKLKLKYTVYA